MSIKALPADTCRLLGSTTLIATPVSLVKELVDNAIDAGATTIHVLVSPNTVDKVEVRDDGHGIDLADFDALGRRGHTSKIRCFEGLQTVGGLSLGFRGEGVASTNTLGYVTITTRTANDAVASTFRLTPNTGGMASDTRKPVPAPIGTTVAVTCLFSSLPVRRKVAVQEAPKTLASIKTLLCGYAMARPHLRLSLKVMRGVVPDWHYSPMAGNSTANNSGGMKQAVLLLFGSEAARGCQEIVVSTDELLGGQSTLSQALSNSSDKKAGNFGFEACLPRLDADLSKLKLGGFISVDGRPLSIHHQSITDKLLTIFHSSLGRLSSQAGSPQAKVRGTFMRLNIQCPAGSYDANVDSAKTDVLFADEKFICDAFATLCAKTFTAADAVRYRQYGNVIPSMSVRTQPNMTFPTSAHEGDRLPQSRTQASPYMPLPAIGSSPIEEPVRPLTSDGPLGMTPCSKARPEDGQSSISQLRGMLTDSPGVTAVATRSLSARGGPIEYNFITSRGQAVRRAPPASSRHIQLSPVRKRSQRRSLPVRRLQSPPASDKAAERLRRHRPPGEHDFAEEMELPGLNSNDRYRQTTISFGGQNEENMRRETAEREHDLEDRRVETHPDTTLSAQQSFMSARDLYSQERAVPGPSMPMQTTASHPTMRKAQRYDEPERTAPVLPITPPPSQETILTRYAFTMRVDQQQLRRSSAAFARNSNAWDEEVGFLSPEMADISSIKSRLRAAVVYWLARTKEDRKEAGEGALQVEFYLRKSLKKKALMVRDSGQ